MHLIIPTTVEIGDAAEPELAITASWHPTAFSYGQPDPETVTVNVLAAGIEIGYRAATAINGLNEIADHLNHVLDAVARSLGVGYGNNPATRQDDHAGGRDCHCLTCKAEHVPDDLFGDLLK